VTLIITENFPQWVEKAAKVVDLRAIRLEKMDLVEKREQHMLAELEKDKKKNDYVDAVFASVIFFGIGFLCAAIWFKSEVEFANRAARSIQTDYIHLRENCIK
jgi:hypothetical protein